MQGFWFSTERAFRWRCQDDWQCISGCALCEGIHNGSSRSDIAYGGFSGNPASFDKAVRGIHTEGNGALGEDFWLRYRVSAVRGGIPVTPFWKGVDKFAGAWKRIKADYSLHKRLRESSARFEKRALEARQKFDATGAGHQERQEFLENHQEEMRREIAAIMLDNYLEDGYSLEDAADDFRLGLEQAIQGEGYNSTNAQNLKAVLGLIRERTR
jgi:hypothetical protein